jgi:hypothetical protein
MAEYRQNYKELIDEAELKDAAKRYTERYNQLGQQAQKNIDAAYAPSVDYQKGLLSQVPAQYDSARRENDYELQVAARRISDQMAMQGQQNSGLNRSQQAGLQASHSKTAGDISAQQRNAELEIRSAISKILAERDKAKADAALQYQEKGQEKADAYVDKEHDRAYDSMWRLNDYQHNFDTMDKQNEFTRNNMILDSDLTLKRDGVQQGYTQDNMRLQNTLDKDKIGYSSQLDTNAYINKAAIDAYYGAISGNGSNSKNIDYDGFAKLGASAGANIAARLGNYFPNTKTYKYESESAREAVGQEIFNSFYSANMVQRNGAFTVDYQSTIGGDEQSMIAFSNAMAAAGLGNYTGESWLAKFAQNQIDSRRLGR